MKKAFIYIGSAVVIVAVGFLVYSLLSKPKKGVSIETAKVTRGSISNTITATGSIEAVKTVTVGTQVSGTIEKLFVDYNSQVKKGQLLAQLDETPLIATLEQSKAALDQAEAQLNYYKATYERYKPLLEKKLIAKADYDQAEYNYLNAVGNLNSAKSAYEKNKINLSYARIYSPIDGTVLDREVEVGQTVAASYSTPTLFTIANDLTNMRVEAKIDEADIGQLRDKQRVEFSVDAFPKRKFAGEVSQIRLEPTTTNNVVTYTVTITAPNPENILKPGMTANAVFYVTEEKDILLVPAKAVHYTPDQTTLEEYMAQLGEKSGVNNPPSQSGDEGEHHSEQKGSLEKAGNDSLQNVWVKEPDGRIHPKSVTVGVTDEVNYEVVNGLKEGEEVIISMTSVSASKGGSSQKAASSPFMPKRPGNTKRSATTNTQQGGPPR
jgi:HlyD family secretion protein